MIIRTKSVGSKLSGYLEIQVPLSNEYIYVVGKTIYLML